MRNGKPTSPEEVRFSTVVADSIVIPGPDGKPAISLGLDWQGAPEIALHFGRNRVLLSVVADGAGSFAIVSVGSEDADVSISAGDGRHLPAIELRDPARGHRRIRIDGQEVPGTTGPPADVIAAVQRNTALLRRVLEGLQAAIPEPTRT